MNARRTVILIAFALAEAALVAPLAGVFVPIPPGVPLAGLIGLAWAVLLLIAGTWRVMAHFDAPAPLQYLASGAWLALCAGTAVLDMATHARSFRPILLDMLPAFVAALIVWWRGLALGRSSLSAEAALLRLQLGLLILVIYGTFTLFTRSTEMLIALPPFLLGSLIAVPLAQIDGVGRNQIGHPVRMSATWWMWTLLPAAGVLAAGVIVVALLSGRSVVEVVTLLVAALFFPLFFLVTLIPASFFERLAELIRQLALNLRLMGPGGLNLEGLQTQTAPVVQPLELTHEANVFIAGAIFVALVLLVVWLAGRSRREDEEALETHDDFESALRRESELATGAAEARPIASLRRWLAALTVRRLYARASASASKRGFPRLNAQTPYDFLPRMSEAFPGHADEARLLTEAYVLAHYGEVPDTREEIDALKQAWERMRA